MRTIPLHGKKAAGRAALIDDGDWDLISQYRWHMWQQTWPGRRSAGPYARTVYHRDGRRIQVKMHTLITGYLRTDHINGNGLDNQRHNLRPATSVQNSANQRPQLGSASIYKGVTWDKAYRRWRAQIAIDHKLRHLGRFDSEEDAARAYDAAALAARGEYAWLNFP